MSRTTYKRSKNTKRFNFQVRRDETSHKTGANSVTISFRDGVPPVDDSSNAKGSYGFGGFEGNSSVTMSVKEAKALQNFLNHTLS